jgi:hypothetical protein
MYSVIKAIYGNLKPLWGHPGGPSASLLFWFGRATGPNGEHNIWGLACYIRPEKLALLICYSDRIIVVQSTINIADTSSVITERLEVSCCG